MTRGDIHVGAERGPYTGKPRPMVIVQDDRFDATASITVCPLTTYPAESPLFRIQIEANNLTGLAESGQIMIDKITSLPRTSLGLRVGRVADADLVRLNRALMVFLGLAA